MLRAIGTANGECGDLCDGRISLRGVTVNLVELVDDPRYLDNAKQAKPVEATAMLSYVMKKEWKQR